MTGERRETTILPNGSDEDLSIVSSDPRTRSQSQVDCMEPNITLQARHKILYASINHKRSFLDNCKQERQVT